MTMLVPQSDFHGGVAQGDVLRVESPHVERGLTPAHLQRHLIRGRDWATTDPFLLMAEDWLGAAVFDHCPHRGFEIFTYVVEGRIEHCDNHGNRGSIGPGDALLVTAGRGVVNSDISVDAKPIHLLQLWINLPRESKLVPAHYQELRANELPVRREPGAELRVFSGASEAAVAATRNHTPLTITEMRLQAGARITQDVPRGFNSFIVVLDGEGVLGSESTHIRAGQIAWLARNERQNRITTTGGEQGCARCCLRRVR
jgi:redox-sensitive bicupin YhaK (pirin superfamily)